MVDSTIYGVVFGGLAQLVEQRTFNPWVSGSSPARVILENIFIDILFVGNF